jgi:magnesium chelatase subunit I
MTSTKLATNLAELRASGWQSRNVKEEIRSNFQRMLASGGELFPGIVGYANTVIPEISLALLAGHDMLFLGEKGQGKSRMMRALPRFLDEFIPYLDLPGCPVHEDPYKPITSEGQAMHRRIAARANTYSVVAAKRTVCGTPCARDKICRYRW